MRIVSKAQNGCHQAFAAGLVLIDAELCKESISGVRRYAVIRTSKGLVNAWESHGRASGGHDGGVELICCGLFTETRAAAIAIAKFMEDSEITGTFWFVAKRWRVQLTPDWNIDSDLGGGGWVLVDDVGGLFL